MKLTSIAIWLSTAPLFVSLTGNAKEQPSSAENVTFQRRLTSPLEYSKAQAWNLKPEEWRRYQQLMDGPLGAYSPGIDPLTALGTPGQSCS